ncbi:kinase-like domain-containing protein [Xylariales sp. AK1849]|nr:kinase-like domain-containing protein [Xylariales sp. AK1849]
MSRVPLAQICCRLIATEKPGLESPGKGFFVSATEDNNVDQEKPIPYHVADLFSGETLTVGRDPDPRTNSICVDHPYVSRVHFEIYSVLFEVDVVNQPYQPMIYVRDRQSLSGTSVNGHLIGSKTHGISPGYLLSQGDVIDIGPYWRFQVCLLCIEGSSAPLKGIQCQEVKIFSDRYAITDRIIGTGGFGRIHLAIEVKTGRQLVCKILNLDNDHGYQAQYVTRFPMLEADILTRTRYPNLLTFEYAFRSKHTVYIFTELATGGDLFSMIESYGGLLSEHQTRFIMHQVIRGISYLHNKGLAHRDLKPENIFFANGPRIRSRIIIGDLGNAKATSWGRLKTNVGTNLYQAPELYHRHDYYKKSVDLWAIGVMMLFVMLPDARNTLPYLKTHNQADIDKHLEEILQPTHPNGGMSSEAQDFVRRCLKVEPELRMTASQAKRHPWLLLPKLMVDGWTQLRNASWKPVHRIPPPIEELPDLQGLASYKHLELTNKARTASNIHSLQPKRKKQSTEQNAEEGSEKSPYFLSSNAVPSVAKKARVSPTLE